MRFRLPQASSWILFGMLSNIIAEATAASNPYKPKSDCSSESIPKPNVFGAKVVSLTAFKNKTLDGVPSGDVCIVTVTITHPGTGDSVNNYVALPLDGWNGVFQGIGGGGYAAGSIGSMGYQTALGYSTVTTDAGRDITADSGDATLWALLSPGNVNQDLLLNFARRSLHDMTVIGKQISSCFYGQPVSHSYWNGCSTGGRQGLVMAQYYPHDYDGILAEAPAIQWSDFTLAQQWPYTVESNEGYVLSPCEQEAVVNATIDACDGLDGLVDGIVSAPAICNLDLNAMVGQSFTCSEDGSKHTYTQQMADVVNKIWQGPRTPQGQFLWYGLPKAANISSLAPNTNGSVAVPFDISDTWIRGFVARNLGFNTAEVSYAGFADLFLQSHIQYDSMIGDYGPDLRPFKTSGGKMITWQGLADQIINPQGTMLYYQKVAALDSDVDSFYRQFYSPGIGHCGGGTGVVPTDPIAALRAWVEQGQAPATLEAASEYPVNASTAYVTNGDNVRFIDLCPYPAVQKYKGGGADPSKASSWECSPDTDGWQAFAGPSGSNYSCVGGPGWYG